MSNSDFNQLLTVNMGQVEQFAFNFTRNETEAQDLFQETLLKALRYKDNYATGTNFKGWLYTIMKNIFINDYKRKKKRNTFVDHTEGQFFLESARKIESESVERGLVAEDIDKAMESLDDMFARPFKDFVHGLHYDEIAENMNLPIGTVKSRIFHARKKLKQELSDYAIK